MSGHRQAAAALHALSTKDRSLIIAQLAAADRDTLRGYLSELDTLGFESAVMDIGIGPVASATGLAAAPAVAIHALLEHEPAALIAQVIAAQPWPWAEALLALYSPARREAIRATVVAVAPARTRFLVDALSAMLAADERPAPVRARPSPLASLLRRVTSWHR